MSFALFQDAVGSGVETEDPTGSDLREYTGGQPVLPPGGRL